MTPAMASEPYWAAAPSCSTSMWLDGAQADEVQVGRRPALERTAQDRQVGRAVAALAVDQHQGVVGRQAAQLGRQRQVGRVAAERLGVERGHVLGDRLDQVGLTHSLTARVESSTVIGAGLSTARRPRGARAGHDDGVAARPPRRPHPSPSRRLDSARHGDAQDQGA